MTEIRFTLKLTDKTCRAFEEAEGCGSPDEIRDFLLERLKDSVDEVREQVADDENE